MTTRQQLIDHLANLERARAEAFAAGDWGRVDFIQLCIDDTRDDLKKAEAAQAAHN